MSAANKTIATIPVGYDPLLPMRTKEAYILPAFRSPDFHYISPQPDFYIRERKGVEVSGAVLHRKEEAGKAATVYIPTRDSNIHILFLVTSPSDAITQKLTTAVSNDYPTNFNRWPQKDLHTLMGLETHVAQAIQETVFPDDIATQTTDASTAFAHIVPKNGKISHAIIGLQKGTRAFVSYHSQTSDAKNTVMFTPEMLIPANEHGLSIGSLLLPRGAKLFLTTDMTGYQTQHGLESLTAFYELSEPILSAIRTNNYAFLQTLPLKTLEHLVFAISPLCFDKRFCDLVIKGHDFAAAGALAAYDLGRLAKDTNGNFTIPEPIAFIGSRIPNTKETRRKKAA